MFSERMRWWSHLRRRRSAEEQTYGTTLQQRNLGVLVPLAYHANAAWLLT